jgi:hypothetical protein
MAGQIAGLIAETKPVEAIIKEMITTANKLLREGVL